MAYTNLHFCWHGMISSDPDRAVAFYSEVAGHAKLEAPMGDELATMLVAGGQPIAHVGTPNMEGEPPHWSNYLRVEDVDASAAACVEHGGAVLVPGTDIPPGRFAVVSSPSGAVVCLFHEADLDTATNHPGGPGSVHWTELHSTDVDADLAWLQAVFGYETGTMPMPNGGTYHLLKAGETLAAGVMPAMHPGAPSMWLSWLEVADVDGAAGRASASGGQLLSEVMDMPGVGRMVMIKDPVGAVVGLIQPAPQG